MKKELTFLLFMIQSAFGSFHLLPHSIPSLPESRKRDLVISNIAGKPIRLSIGDKVQSVVVDDQNVLNAPTTSMIRNQSPNNRPVNLADQRSDGLLIRQKKTVRQLENQSADADEESPRCVKNLMQLYFNQDESYSFDPDDEMPIELIQNAFCTDVGKMEGDVDEIDYLNVVLERAKKQETPRINVGDLYAILDYLEPLSLIKKEYIRIKEQNANYDNPEDIEEQIEEEGNTTGQNSLDEQSNRLDEKGLKTVRRLARRSYTLSDAEKRRLTLDSVLNPRNRSALHSMVRRMRATDIAKLDQKLAMQMKARTKQQLELSRQILQVHRKNLIKRAKLLRSRRRNRRNLRTAIKSHVKVPANLRHNKSTLVAQTNRANRRATSVRRTNSVLSRRRMPLRQKIAPFATTSQRVKKYL
jgi:hypothetical protein